MSAEIFTHKLNLKHLGELSAWKSDSGFLLLGNLSLVIACIHVARIPVQCVDLMYVLQENKHRVHSSSPTRMLQDTKICPATCC